MQITGAGVGLIALCVLNGNEALTLDRDMQQFYYLGEPYECAVSEIKTALRELS